MTLTTLEDRKQGSCFVYVIGMVGLSQPVKIGFATDLGKRIQALQCAHYLELEVKAAHLLMSVPMAKEVEEAAHRALASYRIRGEWFDLSDREAAATLRDNIPEYYEAGEKRQNGNRWETIPVGRRGTLYVMGGPTEQIAAGRE